MLDKDMHAYMMEVFSLKSKNTPEVPKKNVRNPAKLATFMSTNY